jgi:predicted nucleic acid-binding protein
MILLDTNVVFEAMKPEPHPSVRDWLDAQAAETVFSPASPSPNCCSASAR